jgi:hypothetical protein
VDATITTHEHGIVIADTAAVAKRLRTFNIGRAPGAVPAVADSIGLSQSASPTFQFVQPLANKQQARSISMFSPASLRRSIETSAPRALKAATVFATSGADELALIATICTSRRRMDLGR